MADERVTATIIRRRTVSADLVRHGTVANPRVMAGQISIEDCIAEMERGCAEPPRLSYVEPCPECAVGKCGNCDGRTLDHALDEIVPCPCRAAGHTKESA